LHKFGALTGNLNIGWTVGQKYSGKHLLDEKFAVATGKGRQAFSGAWPRRTVAR
jgi:hypothetical protein